MSNIGKEVIRLNKKRCLFNTLIRLNIKGAKDARDIINIHITRLNELLYNENPESHP
jgi:hypothetical protein